ncbi:ABC-type transport system permease protein (probable substrate dipeptides/oligopeptides) [Haloferax gibbonsii ATCC 33959]|uniref:ABC-type transport system permease protein (Probable substrate dipeptides/oligopeptides) n=1 Tax=Haloferax gibbonsii (strain ATCC 33959 / DSM 4427 / JCM 8863 / NBRC 102184 / NCIMB 2188 / Ma 2.38) TaxID=1227459 RepID=M0HT31_HALGM|nr:ABC transporter permease [Haloferax gibbonsii]ELZ86913.1 ABC-type transport system permease protein (probable substrate dipeptides/oligopeptides) [Haloferax gibbonsii ATCC 33959]
MATGESTTESVRITELLTSRVSSVVFGVLSTRKGFISVCFLAPILVLSLAAPLIAPYDPTAIHVADKFAGPGGQYLLGTDGYGRDLLSRVLYGGRASIIIGLASTAFGLVFGVPIGIVSGYLGGRFDELMMRLMDTLLSIPSLLLALLVVTVLGSGIVNTILAIGVVFTPGIARITRSSTLSVKNEEYITAAEARGESLYHIAFREILPNVSSPILVEASIRVGFGILIGTSLSFLGLGTQPPFPDWGYMISVSRSHLHSSIWFMLWPSLALGFTIMGFNLIGDALRDVMDSKVHSD